MGVSEGFKQTEIGEIPLDWNCHPFTEVTRLITCGLAATPKYVPEGNGYPFLSSSNIKNGQILWYNYRHISTKLHKKLYSNNPPEKGDLLYSRVGTIGEAAVIEESFEFSVYVSLTLIKPSPKLDRYYLKHLLNSFPYKQRALAQVYLGGGVGNLNVDVVRQYPIVLPPTKAEQEAIAEALSDADGLIESLEQLIAKKRQIKQGAMQELLTGKRRLPGFEVEPGYKQTEVGEIPNDWECQGIGAVIDLLTGFPFPSMNYTESGIRLLKGANIKRGNTDWTDGITSYWPEVSPDIKKYTLKAGDIVVAMDGSLVGRSFATLQNEDVPALLLQRVARIRSKKVEQEYLKVWICSPFFTIHCDSVKTTTAIPHISPADINSFKIAMPSKRKEQLAIATILSDMDAETTKLEAKLTKARKVKQGMMQELLTGRIRLV